MDLLKVKKDKEKILLVSCNGLGRGGVQSVIMSIVRNLSYRYIFDIVVFTKEKRYYDDEFTSFGGSIIRIPFYEGSNKLLSKIGLYFRWGWLYFKTCSALKKNGPYIAIHCHNNFESAAMLRAAAKCGVPIRLIHSHSPYNEQEKKHHLRQLYNRISRRVILSNSTYLLACSDIAGKVLFGKNGNFQIVNNSYNDKIYHFMPRNNCSKDNLIITQVGSFSSNKNQLMTIRVFDELLQTYPNSKLVFVGFDTSENYLKKMKDEISEKKIENKILFFPADTNIAAILNETDAFLFPSLFESFGIVLLEAQACGVKCYASKSVPNVTDMGGCKYIDIDDGPKAWAQTIVEDFRNGLLKHHKYDCSRYAESKVISLYKDIYTKGCLQE